MSVYRHISDARKAKELPVSLQCEMLGVSESGYWAWCMRAPSDRELSDAWLTERIRRIHAASGGRYGSPRVHAMLAREGIAVGEKRVARLMRAAGLQGAFRRRRKGCTVRIDGVEPFSDLVARDGADAEPVVIGAHRGPEAVVLSYERYLQLAGGRQRVAAALDRQAREAGETLDADDALELADSQLHAMRRERRARRP